MVYTINANAKNVWIRDNENTRDLSIQTDASSVYLDNGRTLEQELGEGSMVSNVATVDTSMSKVIDGTLDGAYESLVFKGKSLVNLVRNTGANLFSTSGLGKINKTETSHGMIYETSREDLNTYITIRTGANPMLKPNTSYTIFFEIVQNTIIKDGQSYKGVTVCGTTDSYYNRATNQLYHNSNFSLDKGVKSILVTTGSDVSSYDGFGFGFPPLSSGGVEQGQVFEIQNVMVIEGDCTNQDVPYFEGLCDSKMPILHNVGKNLFDEDNSMELGAWKADSSPIKVSNEIRCKNNFTPFPNGLKNGDVMRIVLSDTSINSNTNMHVYDESKTRIVTLGYGTSPYIEGTDFINGVSTVTIHDVSKCKYFSFRAVSTNTECKFAIMVNTSAPYEDYKTNILRTSEEIVLRSLPNGVCDTLNVETGEYVQRIGEVIKNNATGFGLAGGGWENKSNVCTFENFKPEGMKVQKAKDKPTLNCDKIPSNTFTTQWSNSKGIESIAQHDWAGIVLSITRDKLLTQDVNGLNTYLQSNPLTIQYELAEPITTIVEPLTIPFAYQNGHIILESGYEGQSLLPTLEYSTVVNRTGQVEGVAKVIQKQEKQLTMLEQMLIQNIIGLDYSNTVLALNLEINEVM